MRRNLSFFLYFLLILSLNVLIERKSLMLMSLKQLIEQIFFLLYENKKLMKKKSFTLRLFMCDLT